MTRYRRGQGSYIQHYYHGNLFRFTRCQFERRQTITCNGRTCIIFLRYERFLSRIISGRFRRTICLILQAIPILNQRNMRNRMFCARFNYYLYSITRQFRTIRISMGTLFTFNFHPTTVTIRSSNSIFKRAICVGFLFMQRVLFLCF